MDVEELSINLSKLSNQLAIIQDYISIKFGLDFEVFCKRRQKKFGETSFVKSVSKNVNIKVRRATSTATSASKTKTRSGRRQKIQNYKENASEDEEWEPEVEVPEEVDMERDPFATGSGSESDISEMISIEGIKREEDDDDIPQFMGSIIKGQSLSQNQLDFDFEEEQTEQFYSQDSSSQSQEEGDEQGEAEGQKSATSRIWKKKRKTWDWVHTHTYETLDEAVTAIKATDHGWNFRGAREGEEGVKRGYDCKLSRTCSAKRHILIRSDGEGVELYSTGLPHDHVIRKRNHGIPEEMKAKIKAIFDSGITAPRRILKALRQSGEVEPNKAQLQNFLQYSMRVKSKEREQDCLKRPEKPGQKRRGRPPKSKNKNSLNPEAPRNDSVLLEQLREPSLLEKNNANPIENISNNLNVINVNNPNVINCSETVSSYLPPQNQC